ncbi:MAG: alpha/beta fold hydrolase [Bradyrhizobium sp.]|uniref:alpha/beta fold hydrolase n=1 Tax=Bradyrhizobium sp. TaxID=376 RepID=UPI001DE2EFE7|nr:alpha/beta hydrolase [Bradyrhizobium sp.]MBV9561108.1 alpha/beta fold hydrolase [Bradyrhizobium sp.]
METIEANGTTICFERTGKGPPLLLLHGAEADHSMFNAFAPLLADSCTVIAYDQRDSGGTSNPPIPYGLEELADDAAALIPALGHPCAHVFGTSFGGVIAQTLASRHPERVDRLVLSSTFRPGIAVGSINPDFPRFAELRSRLPASAAEFAEFFFTRDYLASHPETSAIFGGNSRTDGQKARRGAVLSRPISVDLRRITAPTLVLAGAEDRLIPPAHTLSLVSEIDNARSVVIPGVGHVATRQNPAAVAAPVKAFLQEDNSQRQNPEENDHGRSRGGSRHSV